MHKSPEELSLIQRSIDVTLEAHRTAWKRAAPGEYEYQVAAAMTAVYFGEGCERHAYAPIVGSGPNSTVLHYSPQFTPHGSRRAAADGRGRGVRRIRRRYYAHHPGGRAVQHAPAGDLRDRAGRAEGGDRGHQAGPVRSRDLSKIAHDYINTHGKDLHGESLGKYFTHGVSHHVGLDVHDATDFSQPLAEGNVITVEPGIYIPEESIGVRIEDMVLVTKDGAS